MTAVMKTWVLVESPNQVNDPKLHEILDSPGVVGPSFAQPWSAVERSKGVYDLSKAELVADLAAQHGRAFSYRIRAGVNTPSWWKGRTWTPNQGPGAGLVVPCSFMPDGSPNAVFLAGYSSLMKVLDDFYLQNTLDPAPLHCSWYGSKTAELGLTDDIQQVPGYSDDAIRKSHKALIDVVDKALRPVVRAELPVTGYSPQWFRLEMTAYMASLARDFYTQGNALTDKTWHMWGYGNEPDHGYQLIWAFDRDTGKPWDAAAIYRNAMMSDATHEPASYIECHFQAMQAQDFKTEALKASGLAPLMAEAQAQQTAINDASDRLAVVNSSISDYYRG